MNQKLVSIALFGVIAFPFVASAEIASLDEIVVTATRMPQALNKSIADTSVLNEQDIKKSGAPDVSTLLRSVPGVEIAQNGGLGTISAIYMRGTNSNQVLVLLDGVRINSATLGSTALEHIMLDSIERIEVVRGNVSSLYGSEAIGGVIQLFSKQGHGAPAFNVSAGAGNQGAQHMAAGFSGAMNDTSFSVNAGRIKTDGISTMNPLLLTGANPDKNGYDNTTVNAQIKQFINSDHALTASVFSTRGNSSYDISGLPTAINNIIANIDKFSLASDDQINEIWHSQLRLSQGTDDSQTFGTYPGRFQTRSNQIAWQNNLKIAPGQQLSFSVENLGQAVTSSTLFSQTSRNVNSLLGGYVGEYGVQQVQLNLRQDRYSDFGTANTALLGYGVSFADNWRATASISNAFKAPTFDDMYWPFADYGFGYTYAGNPNLKPERSVNKEAGLHYAANGQRVDAVYFDNRIGDLIVGNGLPALTYINISQAKINGQELSYAGDFGDTHLRASATFQNPCDATTGQILARRARAFGRFGVNQDIGAVNLGAEVRYSGVRQDAYYNINTFANTAVTLPGYQLMSLTARYQIDKSLSLSARAGNLFNRSYSEVYGYNTPGRTLFVGLNYQQ
ncbi:MAG: TonB-dependent receptor [Proteobacteria bacterium]|nr:TonB-dependent receptor [Pseudomonadota bacterium]